MSVFAQLILLTVLIIQSQTLKLKKRSYGDNYIGENENVIKPNDVVRARWEHIDNTIDWSYKLKDEATEEYKMTKKSLENKLSNIKQLLRPLNLNPQFDKTEDDKVKITVILLFVPESHGQRRYKRASLEDILGAFGGSVSFPGEINDICDAINGCKVDNAECVPGGSQSYCQCKEGYVDKANDRKNCYPVRVLGESCQEDVQCTGDAQICGKASSKCGCIGGTFVFDGGCYPLQQELHKRCVNDDQCAMRNSVCSPADKLCECAQGTVESQETPNICVDPNGPSVRTECESKPNLRCVSDDSCDSEHTLAGFDCPLKNDVCCDRCETYDLPGSSCLPRHECPHPYRKKGYCDTEGEQCCMTCVNSLDGDCVSSDECPSNLQLNMFCSFKSDVCCMTCARMGGRCVPSSRCLPEDQDPQDSYCPNNHVCCLN